MALKKSKNINISETADVDAFIKNLDHPLKAELELVRSVILGADPRIREGIKWNSPSFHVDEYFATINIRKDVVLIILHLGAKVKDNSTAGLAIPDPDGLLEWLAKDRAAVRFADMESIKKHRGALEKIVRGWIRYLS
ncbi:MAG: DUF1801 domain-containing protein [Planctomycetes bacterium]|nr:DUF1801 domain-containing protein [Planctomycetota bacterium]